MTVAIDFAARYDDAPCGLLAAAMDGSLLHANHTLRTWLGVPALPARVSDMFTKPGTLFFETHCIPLLRLQNFVSEISLDVRRDAGDPLPVILSARVHREPDAAATIHAVLLHAPTRREYEQELQRAQQAAQATAEQLRRQAQELAERSALLIPVRHDLRVMPVIGAIDEVRGRHIVKTLLNLDASTGVRTVLIDLTGVPELDAAAAAVLRNAAAGLRLRGVRPVLTGIRSSVAASMAKAAFDLGDIKVCGTLQDGIAWTTTTAR